MDPTKGVISNAVMISRNGMGFSSGGVGGKPGHIILLVPAILTV